MSAITPSRIARTIAAAQWPDVQFQSKVAKGIYHFTCAGHGGVVAVIGEADLTAHAVQCARDSALIELVAVQVYGRRSRTFTTEKYTPDSLRELAARDPRTTIYEVWVGEEDCDWATILMANPEAISKGQAAGVLSESLTLEDVRACVESYNAAFLARLEGRRHYVCEHVEYNPRRVFYAVYRLNEKDAYANTTTREAADQIAYERERVTA